MNILWIKDNNIGHEKQVKALLDEFSKNNDLNIDQRTVKGLIPFFRYIDDVQENYYDILIGAGHKTYSFLLDIKKYQKDKTKNIAILAPSFNKDKFDIICAPIHDAHKLKGCNNVISFEGSLSKVSLQETDKNLIMVAIGGKNKHYVFNEIDIISQINYFLSLHPNKDCYIFNSRRTPSSMNTMLKDLSLSNKDITFCDFKDISHSFENTLHISSSKLITRDSVNMVYESLSSKGNTYLIDMPEIKNDNKIVQIINNLILNKKIGYIKQGTISNGISKMTLNKQNIYNEVFAEVEKVSYELNKLI
jgi:mitochondrial fission protein ELM1